MFQTTVRRFWCQNFKFSYVGCVAYRMHAYGYFAISYKSCRVVLLSSGQTECCPRRFFFTRIFICVDSGVQLCWLKSMFLQQEGLGSQSMTGIFQLTAA